MIFKKKPRTNTTSWLPVTVVAKHKRFLSFCIAWKQTTLFPLFTISKCTERKQKQTTTNTIMLFFCFSYYVFINKKQKQLEEHHISTPLPNYVALQVKHTNITQSFINHVNTMWVRKTFIHSLSCFFNFYLF